MKIYRCIKLIVSFSTSKCVESPNKKITMNIFELGVVQKQIQKMDIIHLLFSARLFNPNHGQQINTKSILKETIIKIK